MLFGQTSFSNEILPFQEQHDFQNCLYFGIITVQEALQKIQ